MIPKIIHYCWFGGKSVPKDVIDCINSWKKYMPTYEIILWDEDNFDIESNRYVKEAYASKKFAFVADYVRLFALHHFGGIYLDTDVEVLKPLDSFLIHKAFFGFEDENLISTAIIGSEKNGVWVKMQLDSYKNRVFIKDNGDLDTTTNVVTITANMVSEGLVLNNNKQNIHDMIEVYPKDYFSPKSYVTGRIELTKNTYTIHHFGGSWLPVLTRFRISLYHILGSKFSCKPRLFFKPFLKLMKK